jgi:hypothetical protein
MPPDRVAASALRAEAARRFLCDGATAGRLTPIRHISRDEGFFEKVFIDCGAVAWPGEIDLAPAPGPRPLAPGPYLPYSLNRR